MELRKYAVYFSDDCIFIFEATDIVSAMRDANKYAYDVGIFVQLVEPFPLHGHTWEEREVKKDDDDTFEQRTFKIEINKGKK